MWRSRMFWRLFGTFAGLLLATIAVLGIIVLNRVEKHFLQQIEESLEAKAILVRESLDLAQIESGTEVFDYHAVSLNEAVRSCLEHQRVRAEAKKQHLEFIPLSLREGEALAEPGSAAREDPRPPGVRGQGEGQSQDLAAWADEEAIGQILDNLVD